MEIISSAVFLLLTIKFEVILFMNYKVIRHWIWCKFLKPNAFLNIKKKLNWWWWIQFLITQEVKLLLITESSFRTLYGHFASVQRTNTHSRKREKQIDANNNGQNTLTTIIKCKRTVTEEGLWIFLQIWKKSYGTWWKHRKVKEKIKLKSKLWGGENRGHRKTSFKCYWFQMSSWERAVSSMTCSLLPLTSSNWRVFSMVQGSQKMKHVSMGDHSIHWWALVHLNYWFATNFHIKISRDPLQAIQCPGINHYSSGGLMFWADIMLHALYEIPSTMFIVHCSYHIVA